MLTQETEPCLITLRILMSCSATSRIRPARSVRQPRSRPAAVRHSRRDSARASHPAPVQHPASQRVRHVRGARAPFSRIRQHRTGSYSPQPRIRAPGGSLRASIQHPHGRAWFDLKAPERRMSAAAAAGSPPAGRRLPCAPAGPRPALATRRPEVLRARRRRRARPQQCLGGLIYRCLRRPASASFAPVGWMAASDVLALVRAGHGDSHAR